MNKNDLENRMVIKTAKGHLLMIVDDLAIGEKTFIELDSYNIDLTTPYDKDLDIVAIYGEVVTLDEINKETKCLWQRAPKLENGMVVDLKNRKRFIVVGNYLMGERVSINLNRYRKDLTNKDLSDLNIEAIYKQPCCLKDIDTIEPDKNYIWKRK